MDFFNFYLNFNVLQFLIFSCIHSISKLVVFEQLLFFFMNQSVSAKVTFLAIIFIFIELVIYFICVRQL